MVVAVLLQWLQFLSACTGTGFAAAQAPKDVLRITFVNRPWSAGRSFLNLHEVVVWLTREWLPARKLPRPFVVRHRHCGALNLLLWSGVCLGAWLSGCPLGAARAGIAHSDQCQALT